MDRAAEILLVEDDPGHARLTLEAFKDTTIRNNLHIMENGEEAMAFLRRQGKYVQAVSPDIIMLDLNLPKKDGREVLAELKADEQLRCIPVIVLSASTAAQDVQGAYHLHANCYISKPIDLNQFMKVIRSIEDFWLTTVKLPRH